MVRALSSSEYSFMIGENFKITIFRLLKNAFMELPRPWYDLIINTLCRTVPKLVFQKKLSSVCHEKLSEKCSSILYGGILCPCFTLKSSRGRCCFNNRQEVWTKCIEFDKKDSMAE